MKVMDSFIDYKPFKNYILRVPLMSVNFYKDFTEGQNIQDVKFKKLLSNPIISEALFLASPVLYNEVEKWIHGQLEDKKKIDKIKHSILKYVSRMSSRCTPFGLFAGCNVGEINKVTNISLNQIENYKRITRLDMSYLVALSDNLSKNKDVIKQIFYYPNTSIYKISNQFRYVEHEFDGISRKHHIVEVEQSTYLEKVLNNAKNGILFDDLVNLLVDDENPKDHVNNYVWDLIKNQILVNELEPSVSGPDFLEHIIKVLLKINGVEYELKILLKVQDLLNKLDAKVGNSVSIYREIANTLEQLNTKFDIKFLFQTDLFFNTICNKLDNLHLQSVKKGLKFLNKITPYIQINNLNQFKNAFLERYDGKEMPLEKVLDVESGIGYKQDIKSREINPLIDDIIFHNKNTRDYKEIKLYNFDSIFQKKLLQSYMSKDYSIKFYDSDVENLIENWEDLPDTFSAFCELVCINGEEKILLGAAGASSAANVSARFCHGDHDIDKFVKNIIEIEEDLSSNKILAEILHLPESRVGNVIMRPVLRRFEIPYLSRSVLPVSNQIPISDILISIKSDKIHLRSKKMGIEIEPRLTNAHNYNNNNALPIYHFLSDMQFQNKRPSIGLYCGAFNLDYTFIPRIEYENMILSEALWNISTNDITNMLFDIENDYLLQKHVNIFREKYNIPEFVLFVESDHELLINFSNLSSIRMLLKTVKNLKKFQIKEFLYQDKGIVKNLESQEYFTNEFILSFYKSFSNVK
jgi:hypothetical protein